jgi:UTP--glucose-1-phosphate uridylyltransferase
MKIRKAVFPVAGLGTRVLPATKAMPKEMLTIVDRPLIQYVVDEAREAGIEHFVFVTGRNKGVIEDHFDRQFELDTTLRERARKAEMIDAAADLGPKANVLAVQEVPAENVHQYGIVGVGAAKGQAFEVTSMVEKPARENAPSNLSITGRYVLQPEIFRILETQERGAGGEIQLTDGMVGLSKSQKFYGVRFAGERHDCGSKAGFLRANIAYGLRRPELADGLRAEMQRYLRG